MLQKLHPRPLPPPADSMAPKQESHPCSPDQLTPSHPSVAAVQGSAAPSSSKGTSGVFLGETGSSFCSRETPFCSVTWHPMDLCPTARPGYPCLIQHWLTTLPDQSSLNHFALLPASAWNTMREKIFCGYGGVTSRSNPCWELGRNLHIAPTDCSTNSQILRAGK